MGILSRTKQAQQWRSARMVRFAQTQLRKREWRNFEEIVVLCSEMNGSGMPDEAVRENTWRNLELGLLNGDFEENGRSRVFYLHPSTVRTRMTREWYRDAIDYNYDGYQGRSQFLPWCWISRSMYERLAAKHYLPSAPPRFRPEHAVTDVVVAQPTPSDKLPRAIAKRRRPAAEWIRQELESKAPEYIDTPGDKTCWSIAKSLVETRGSDRKFEIEKTSKRLQRHYDRLKDRSQD